MRIYNPRIAKFLSVDPLSWRFPELTPYQFASNRPIDGVDLDGLEYATFNIVVDYTGKVLSVSVTKDYSLKNKGSKGPGVQYNYTHLDECGDLRREPTIVFVKNNIYGIYAGSKNPKLPKIGADYKSVFDDYSLDPIDEVDALAKQHDLDYDKDNITGLEGVLTDESSTANKAFIDGVYKIIEKKKKKENDRISHEKYSRRELRRGKFAKNAFEFVENRKIRQHNKEEKKRNKIEKKQEKQKEKEEKKKG